MTAYLVTEVAQGDIEEIVATIAEDNAEAAEIIEDRIYETFDLLAQLPGIGHSREDLTTLPVLFHRIMKTSYMAIYTNGSPITIIRVVHGRRDIMALLKDESTV
jgi:plasmid stabilization system protein ParE